MAKRWVGIGQKVRFDPFEDLSGYGIDECRGVVDGTIAEINVDHQWFSVVFGDPVQRISFKFCDIGKSVKLVG